MNHNDYASEESINLNFDFPFYNNYFSSFIVNSNGWLGFGEDNTGWENLSIPNNQAPLNAIFGFWDDLNPLNDNCSSCAGEVLYHTNGARLVVWFNNVEHWPSYFDNSIYNFQIVIYSTGEIRYNYDSMSGDFSSATIGMQNAQGNSGLQMTFNTSYAHDNLSTYISKGPSWIGINQIGDLELSGELEEGFSESINIIAQNDALPDGVYNAYLNLSSNASESESFLIELISSNNSLLGDVNGDSIINVLDVIQIVNMALGNQDPDYTTADVNQDGVINVLDVVTLVNYITGNLELTDEDINTADVNSDGIIVSCF